MTDIKSAAILVLIVTSFQNIHYFNAMRTGFLLIFSATLSSTLLQQFLDHQIEKMIGSTEGLSSMIWIWGFFSLLTALLFPLIQGLLCSYFLTLNKKKSTFQNSGPEQTKINNPCSQTNIIHFFSEHFELSLIETLRSWGKSFLWFFAFIIPGFIRYATYSLAPLIVLFSKNYQAGNTDALELSSYIFKKNVFYYSSLFLIFYFILPTVLATALDPYRAFDLHPVAALITVVMDTFLLMFFYFLILKKILFTLEQEKDLYYGSNV